MDKLIRRGEFIKNIENSGIVDSEDDAWVYSFVIAAIEETPTVDAVPVVHAEWIEHKWAEEVCGWLISNFECSQCHVWKRYNTNFCPECGADMRKKVQE